MGSTDQADPSCLYFRISWILIEHTLILFFLPPQLVAGPQKPQTLTASKPKYENFEPKFKTSWPQKISIYKILFDTINTLILRLKKAPNFFQAKTEK